jgi:hypothetical protein
MVFARSRTGRALRRRRLFCALSRALPPAAMPAAGAPAPADAEKKKKGVLGRIFGALAGSGDKEPSKEKEKQKQP